MTARHTPPAEGATWEPGDATADLHAHSRRSDGTLEPAELVRQAYDAGVRLFAVADHDNLAAYRELTAPGAPELPDGLTLVPAVEINAVTRRLGLDLPEGELHILGLGVDPWDDAFEAALAAQRDARRRRFTATVAKLRGLGIPVDDHLPPGITDSDDALGRPMLARALVAAGHVESVDDAFRRVLAFGQPGYMPRSGLDPAEAIRAIRAAGGLVSLAHFGEAPRRLPLMREMMGEGLDGLETHHRSFDPDTRASMDAVAVLLGLVRTGGTDFHGDYGPYAEAHSALDMPADLVDGLRAALATRRGLAGGPAAGSTI